MVCQRHTPIEKYRAYIQTLEADKVALVTFKCPHCTKEIKTMAAPPMELWDTASTCPYCRALFWKVTAGDQVVAQKLLQTNLEGLVK